MGEELRLSRKGPKRVWKPLDAGGLRLYKVIAWDCRGKRVGEHGVMAKSPSDAANRVIDCGYDPKEYTVMGQAFNVLMPEDWWTDGVPCIVCKARHEKLTQGEEG